MDESSFFSIDKLMEFGLGMGVASQMAQSMNQSLQSMLVPGVDNPMPQQEGGMYYVVLDGQAAGPFSLTDMSRLIIEKKVMKETYVWKPGMNDWALAGNVSELLKLAALVPPPIPQSERSEHGS